MSAQPPRRDLTPRQRDVLQKMSEGWELRWIYSDGFRLSDDDNAATTVGHQTVTPQPVRQQRNKWSKHEQKQRLRP